MKGYPENLRIKVFYGIRENAVYSQIWITSGTYLMVVRLNKTHDLDEGLSRILQILSVNIFQ
ncbi:MAG: hypothetical protein ACI9UA_004898 [Pseudoalteromonas tetraodonis]|jgi:hypothetical protein